jgi:heptosyltransferase-1
MHSCKARRIEPAVSPHPQGRPLRILIVKLSSLGDVVHTLPVVNDVHQAVPGARVDWVVEKSFAPLLSQCAGIERVIPCELRRWRKSPLAASTRSQWRAFMAALKQQPYDAVIDLQGLSKSALMARLARLAPGGKRYAMAHPTDGSSYEAPTRWLADVAITLPRRVHAVQRGRLLCAQALGYVPGDAVGFEALGRSPAQASVCSEPAVPTVLLVHGTSRRDKEWPFAHWVQLGAQLRHAGFGVALAHGSAAEEATSCALAQAITASTPTLSLPVAVWPRLPLDQLSCAMAACCGVVGVDSGLSHIAVALNLPHVQLYNFDTAWRTGPPAQGEPGARAWQRSVFAQPTPSVQAVWQAWQACVQSWPQSSSPRAAGMTVAAPL